MSHCTYVSVNKLEINNTYWTAVYLISHQIAEMNWELTIKKNYFEALWLAIQHYFAANQSTSEFLLADYCEL